MDTNDTNPIIDTKAPDQTSEVKSEDQQKYQQILDEYSQELDKNPAKPNLDIPIPPLPPTPPLSPTTELPSSTPPEPDPLPEPPPPKKKFNLFKYLFYISALVFLVLVGLLVKDYLTLQQAGTSSLSSPAGQSPTAPVPTTAVNPTDVPTQTDSVCDLNDIIYQVGDTVPSQDDCNTCTCLEGDSGPQITCTEKDCIQITPSL